MSETTEKQDDVAADLIELFAEQLNNSMNAGLSSQDMLRVLAAMVAMGIEIAWPLLMEKDRVTKFQIMLKEHIDARDKIKSQPPIIKDMMQ